MHYVALSSCLCCKSNNEIRRSASVKLGCPEHGMFHLDVARAPLTTPLHGKLDISVRTGAHLIRLQFDTCHSRTTTR